MAFANNRTPKTSRAESAPKKTTISPAKSSGFKKQATSSYKKQGETNWISMGSITRTKKDSEDPTYNDICEALKGSDYAFNVKIYLPKEFKQGVAIQAGDLLRLSFRSFDDDPEFVVGRISLLPAE